MKKIWKRLPSVIRWFLVTLAIICVSAGAVSAYVAITSTGDITIDEALSFVGENTFSVSMYPLESEIVQLTIPNASSLPIDVDLLSEIVPDPGPQGLTVDVPSKITIPATGQLTVDITITAGKNAVPDTYAVSIQVDR